MTLFNEQTKAKFHSKYIKTDGCWEWQGCLASGYGMLFVTHTMNGITRRWIGAHRYSLMLNLDISTLEFRQKVCHTCDNPSCVNPSHLYLGTNQQNMLDAVARGLSNNVNGEQHGRSVLKKEQVLQIRSLVYEGYTHRRLAKMFNVSSGCISDILSGRRWNHLLSKPVKQKQ